VLGFRKIVIFSASSGIAFQASLRDAVQLVAAPRQWNWRAIIDRP